MSSEPEGFLCVTFVLPYLLTDRMHGNPTGWQGSALPWKDMGDSE
jgi:hypothetical protein